MSKDFDWKEKKNNVLENKVLKKRRRKHICLKNKQNLCYKCVRNEKRKKKKEFYGFCYNH